MPNSQKQLIAALAVVTTLTIAVVGLLLLPYPGRTQAEVSLRKGTSIEKAAQQLAEKGVIMAPQLVTLPITLQNKNVVAGTYRFDSPVSPVTAARRLTGGDFGMPQTSVTIPEGITNEAIAERLSQELGSDFSSAEFLQSASSSVGYLFPETYQLHPSSTAEEIIDKMRAEFQNQTASLSQEIAQSKYTEYQIITMASLVEREAADYQTRRRVAGVLWNRFDQDMPLQADAVFSYLLNKSSAALTQKDLDIDSPYNLYSNVGLPPTPIANPSLSAIQATLNPIRTDGMYYLTGDDENFHFAETFDEHKENKRKFIGE